MAQGSAIHRVLQLSLLCSMGLGMSYFFLHCLPSVLSYVTQLICSVFSSCKTLKTFNAPTHLMVAVLIQRGLLYFSKIFYFLLYFPR